MSTLHLKRPLKYAPMTNTWLLSTLHNDARRLRAATHNQRLINAPIKLILTETGTLVGVVYGR